MAINYDKLINLKIPVREQSYTEKDAIIYALGVGLGMKPADRGELRFVFEKDLRVLPSMAVVLAHPGFWPRDLDTGIDWVKVVHGEQAFILHKSLPAAATVISNTRIVDIVDKGVGRGALVYSERRLFEKSSGDALATITQTFVCRGDGGFGEPSRRRPQENSMPARSPDFVCELPTSAQAALIYRLSGDANPLHADPSVATGAGFERPILHGLATFGVAAHAILRTVCDYDPEQFISMEARFTAPVYPGETFRTEIWSDGRNVSFQVQCVERDLLAIGNGRVTLQP